MDDFNPPMPVVSVTQFNQMVKDVLTEVKVWVQGEVSGFKISQNKWVTFDLKDEGSKVNCFMTKYQLDHVLEDGMEIKIFGNPSIYVPYGKYSFIVQRVEPVGEGALKRAFELTKKKLEDEGLFDPIYKKSIPKYPQTIGIVTSEGAAAYTDFLRIINNRWGGVEMILKPSIVQGNNAPGEVVAAIEWFNKYHPVDVMVVTRGGGSMEDLMAFNSEQVCRAIFSSRIPIVCGIGHERDTSLAELTADVRASTPSNAAEIVVPDRNEVLWQLNQAEKTMISVIDDTVNNYRRDLEDIIMRMEHAVSEKFASIDEIENKLQFAFQSYQGQIVRYQDTLKNNQSRLSSSFSNILQSMVANVNQKSKLLSSYNPKQVLKRGYSIVRLGNGQVLKSLKQIKKGETIQTELGDGSFTAEVREKGKKSVENGRLF